jgi:hypothetical protein
LPCPVLESVLVSNRVAEVAADSVSFAPRWLLQGGSVSEALLAYAEAWSSDQFVSFSWETFYS